jgi:accessory colonization factor AcfC
MSGKKTRLELLLAFADKIARKTFATNDGIATGWLRETDAGDHFAIYTPWVDSNSKTTDDAALRQIFVEKNVVHSLDVMTQATEGARP